MRFLDTLKVGSRRLGVREERRCRLVLASLVVALVLRTEGETFCTYKNNIRGGYLQKVEIVTMTRERFTSRKYTLVDTCTKQRYLLY